MQLSPFCFICVCVSVCVCGDHRVPSDRHLCLGAARFDHQRILMVPLCGRDGFIGRKPPRSGNLKTLTPHPSVFSLKGSLLFSSSRFLARTPDCFLRGVQLWRLFFSFFKRPPQTPWCGSSIPGGALHSPVSGGSPHRQHHQRFSDYGLMGISSVPRHASWPSF